MANRSGAVENGRELTVFYISLQQLLLPPSRRHKLRKLMATQWHLMAGNAAASWRIASNIVEEDNHKLRVSNFYFNYI